MHARNLRQDAYSSATSPLSFTAQVLTSHALRHDMGFPSILGHSELLGISRCDCR